MYLLNYILVSLLVLQVVGVDVLGILYIPISTPGPSGGSKCTWYIIHPY